LLWVAHMSYFHGVANKGIDPELFHTLVLVRNLLVVAVCVAVIVEIYRPDLDLVRRSHRDDSDGTDPLAGVLAGPRADRSDAGGPSVAGASGGESPADGPLEYVAQSTGQGAEPAAPDTSGDAHEKENPAR